MARPPPFSTFAPPLGEQTALRRAITAATRTPEAEAMAPLIEQATLSEAMRTEIAGTARGLASMLRAAPERSGVAALVQEFGLSNPEGVALMCLAEALLRIPDAATRDALIRDKIAPGDWKSHLGLDRSLFVNAATWGLLMTGRLATSVDEVGLSAALTRLIGRAGVPVIRRSVAVAMRMMGEQFVIGQTIHEALDRARTMEAKGFTYSFDMLGEAAITAADAARYYEDYERAIHAIGKVANGREIHDAPGISIKLSALHPRYERAQAERVMAELLPRLSRLTKLAARYGIGLNIDAEEADRLELSLGLFEGLCLDLHRSGPDAAGWSGLGFVVQAYGKRCPFVIDWLIDLARRFNRRLMVRLVKGAYWDSEIKRAQEAGLADFPVFTVKSHTDVSYIACARKLLAARDKVFPQFATHNAQTVATIHALAGPDFALGDWEFQCLHGMGEPLYEWIVDPAGLNRPCRIYAPVGNYETLLAYLVRRLLENGANSSFVHRVHDESVSLEALVADPVQLLLGEQMPGAPNPLIVEPRALYTGRVNSSGLDLADEGVLAALGDALKAGATREWQAAGPGRANSRPIRNPSDRSDIVGTVREANADDAREAAARAARSGWPGVPIGTRAAILERASDAMQSQMPLLMGLAMREAGKTAANAVGEVREAVDFLRYYAMQGRKQLTCDHHPIGPVAAISPWNFPLAIFTGQVAAALMAGNPVLAKPAEETPLIAAAAVDILHASGVPQDALHLLPGGGQIGAALVAASEVAGVLFTGSTEVARLINADLAQRLAPDGRTIPLIAETGGQNAMIVDSSALTEQVVRDVMSSAFDSAGQRCSSLRVLCLQEEIADRTLAMLKGALAELRVAPTDRLSSDIGPVITDEARRSIEAHIAAMRTAGARIERLALAPETGEGTFVAPTIIEIDDMALLRREVFGPVLHVLRYRRYELDAMIDAINATGYGLTFGVQSRLDAMVAQCSARIRAGNLYVNRNMIGAIVGSQPFGGRGLSGTGPKAGGPLYLGRLVKGPDIAVPGGVADPAALALARWLEERQEEEAARAVRAMIAASPVGQAMELPGPVGEQNIYAIHPRGTVLLRPDSPAGLLVQLGAALATGNIAAVDSDRWNALISELPSAVSARLTFAAGVVDAALVEAGGNELGQILAELAMRPGPLIPVQTVAWRLDWLVHEVSTAINTSAAGGNASLMAVA